jgi:hypothetical protein
MLSLAPGFSPVTLWRTVLSAASAAFGMVEKPLKRLARVRQSNTGLKPGANEMTALNKKCIMKTRPMTFTRGLKQLRRVTASGNKKGEAGASP